MRKLILSLALVFTFSTTLLSCRDTKKTDDVEDVVDDMEDTMDDMEDKVEETLEKPVDDDGTDPVENTLQEGLDETQENTGLGGEDDAG